MDRDKRGGPPPDDPSSFDLAKMSEAEAAARMAERMAQWRRTRKRPEAPAAGSGAQSPAARSPATASPAAAPPAAAFRRARSPAADRPARQLQLDLEPAMALRIDRAMRSAAETRVPQTERAGARAARRAPAYGWAFTSLLAEGPNLNAVGMRPQEGPRQPLRLYAPGSGVRAGALAASHALRLLLEGRLALALRRIHPLGAAAHAGTVAAWQRLRPALEHRIDQGLRSMHAADVAACGLGITAWRAAQTRIGQAQRNIRAAGLAARARSVALWRALQPVLERGADRALAFARIACAAARRAGVAAWHALRRAADHAMRRARVLDAALRERGVAVWQAPAGRFLVSGAAAALLAIAGWCLAQPHLAAPPEVAVAPPVMPPHGVAGAPAIVQPAIVQPAPPIAAAPLPAQPPAALAPAALAPSAAEAPSWPIAPRLKPLPQAPKLAVLLKPALPKTAKPSRDTRASAPPPAVTPPTGHSPETPEEIRRRADPRAIDNTLDRMFSDGLSRLSRRMPRW